MEFIKKNRLVINVVFFLLVLGLSIYTIFYSSDIGLMIDGLNQLSPVWIIACVMAAVMFILFESIVLGILVKPKEGKLPLLKCIKYALIGYFYSGITPSGTGGQPLQLVSMMKDGYKSSKSSATLLVMAFYYKLVMVLIGLSLLLFWLNGVESHLQSYSWVFYLGLSLNVLVLIVILSLIFIPKQAKWLITKCEQLLIHMRMLRASKKRSEKIDAFIGQYGEAVKYMFQSKLKISMLIVFTFIQRALLMLIPLFIYLGLPLGEDNLMTIFLIQMTSYVAVDMLPLPGAQGITELIFIQSLGPIFTSGYITSSMVLTRGIGFYFLLILGMLVVIYNRLIRLKKSKITVEKFFHAKV